MEAWEGTNVACQERAYKSIWARFLIATLFCRNSIIDSLNNYN